METQAIPIEVKPVPAELNQKLRKMKDIDVPYVPDYVTVGPDDFLLMDGCQDDIAEFYNCGFKPDDVIVMSLPRTGSHLVAEIIGLMRNGFDFEKHKVATSRNFIVKPGRFVRFLFQRRHEYCWDDMEFQETVKARQKSQEEMESQPGRRIIKTHYPLQLFPSDILDKNKVVYVARNPLDVSVSLYHYWRGQPGMRFVTSLEDYAAEYMNGHALCLPFWPHVLEAWKKRGHPNLLFVQYEHIKKDFRGQLRRIAQFLDIQVSDSTVEEMFEYFQPEQAKKNPALNYSLQKFSYYGKNYFQRGEVGDGKKQLSPEMTQRMLEWVEENLRGTGLEM